MDHDDRIADGEGQMVRRRIELDRHSELGGKAGQRVGATDHEAVGLAGYGEDPLIPCHQRARQHRNGRGTLDLRHVRHRYLCPGTEVEGRLESATCGVDDDDDSAFCSGAEARYEMAVIVDASFDLRGEGCSNAWHGCRAAGGIHRHREAMQPVDHDGPGIGVDRRAREFHQRGRRRPRVDRAIDDAQGIDTGRGLDMDRLHLGHRRHAKAGQRRTGQDAGVAIALGPVIHVQGVVARAADQRQQRIDGFQQVGGRRQQVRCCIATDPELVVAGSGIDGRVAVDGLDVDVVVTGATGDVGRSGVCREDVEDIVAATQFDVEHLEVAIDDAARQGATADDGIAAHAEAGEVIRRQEACVIGRAVAVEDVQRIHLLRFVHAGIQVDRPVEVLVAGEWRVELAGFDDGDLPDRRHVRRRDEVLASEIDDDQASAFRGRGKGDDPADANAVAQGPRHVGQRFARADHVGVRGREGGIVEDDGPHLAGEQGVGCQVNQLRLAGNGGIRRVRKAEVGPGAIDDQEGRAVCQCGEVFRRIDIEGGGKALDDFGGGVVGDADIDILRG